MVSGSAVFCGPSSPMARRSVAGNAGAAAAAGGVPAHDRAGRGCSGRGVLALLVLAESDARAAGVPASARSGIRRRFRRQEAGPRSAPQPVGDLGIRQRGRRGDPGGRGQGPCRQTTSRNTSCRPRRRPAGVHGQQADLRHQPRLPSALARTIRCRAAKSAGLCPASCFANAHTEEVLQTPTKVVILYQFNKKWRVIWTDGRALPRESRSAGMGETERRAPA